MRTTTSPAQSKTTVDSRLHMRAVMATPRVWCQRVSTLRLGFLNQQDSHNILLGGSPFLSFRAEIKCEMPRVCFSQILFSRHPQNRELKTIRNETVKNNKQ